MRWTAAAIIGAASALAASAMAETLSEPMAPLSFMVGDWKAAGNSTGPGAGGTSSIHPDLAGRILVRRDHVDLRAGGAFDIFQMIYADGGDLRAEFIDTEGHTIHYKASLGPGRSVVFDSGSAAGAPSFRLTYSEVSADRLHVRFEIAPPGGTYKVLSEGDLVRKQGS
jgi:hypothetical protein